MRARLLLEIQLVRKRKKALKESIGLPFPLISHNYPVGSSKAGTGVWPLDAPEQGSSEECAAH